MQEENKNNEDLSFPVQESESAASPLAQSVSEPAPTEGESAPQASDAALTEAPLSWRFGENGHTPAKAEEKHSAKSFMPVFLGVIAFCLALLVLLLFIGDAGIHVYREIHTERTIYVREDGTVTGMLSPNEAADIAARSTVTVVATSDTMRSIGSGFIYTADGYIITNEHVVSEMDKFQVILPSGEAVDAVLRGSEPYADVAVLKIDRTDLVPMGIGSSSALTVGEDVVVVGTPGTLNHQNTAVFGKISGLERYLTTQDSFGNVLYRVKMLQTDAEINPGNSGGPLVDLNGKVVGINSRRFVNYNGNIYMGLGFAIPIDDAKIIIDQLIQTGSFTGENPVASGKCLLGITGRGLEGGYWYSDLQAETVERSATEKEGYVYIEFDGVYVGSVGGTNVIGKLEVGDMITRINGLYMRTIQDVIETVNRYPAYSEVTLTVMRKTNGSYSEITVKVRLDLADLD